jgi:hypothetical protein
MSHIIQPIFIPAISANQYCCKCYGVSEALGRGTKGVLTSDLLGGGNSADVSANDCSPWTAFTGHHDSNEGEISFGVSCGSSVQITLTSTVVNPAHNYIVEVEFYIDGNIDSTTTLDLLDPNDILTLSVTGSLCGKIITVYAYPTATDDYFDATVTMEVISITT